MSHHFYTLSSTTTKMIYHSFFVILGNCQISKPLFHHYIPILIHKLTLRNNGNGAWDGVGITYIFIRSVLPDALHSYIALSPECLMFNLDSASRLLVTLGGNPSCSVEYNRAFYAILQNRFSVLLAARCHHLMSLDVVTFIYS